MKPASIILLSLLLLTSCDDRVRLSRNGIPVFDILTGTGTDSITIRAAETLGTYLKRITGIQFSIADFPGTGNNHICIGRSAVSDSSVLREISNLRDEGFIVQITGDRITLAGKNGISDYFAVTTFLEEYLGCIKFTGNEEYVPKNSNITVSTGKKSYEPSFAFRHPYFSDRQNKEFLSWHKLSGFDNWGLFVHTFQRLCPPEKYFGKHPEYFSLVSGKRISDGQLCLSNPEVIKLLGDNLGELIEQQPEKTYWSVSQNDCINYCECAGCKKLYDRYKNISGAYIEMANVLAYRFPDKQISTLAYQFTRQAPENIIPRKNVNIMFCSIECNRSMALENDPRSSAFIEDMKDWEKLSNNIFVWDYVVQFKTYLCPFPNFHVLKPNIGFFRDHNAAMMFQQGSGDGWSDLCEMKQYLIAKLLWNPDLDADSVNSRFIEKYYGPAAPYIKKYHSATDRLVQANQEKWSLDIYGLPSFYFNTFLTGEHVSEYEKLMDKAEKSVSKDSVYLKRVLKTRCAVDFAYIDYALNSGDKTISFLDEWGKTKSLNSRMVKLLDNFISNCDHSGITTVGEEKLTVHEYRDHIITVVNLALIQNKAAGKSIKTLTDFNPRYSDPGVKALTDGIFGGRHFNSGWLGYQGDDMKVEIDLGGSETVHKISMNFLRDFVSWVFLPDTVKIELSADGINFTEAAKITNIITDRRFGVEPVFHSLEFDPAEARFIRIRALSMKKCPEWHRGAGQPSWVFCDEIIVE